MNVVLDFNNFSSIDEFHDFMIEEFDLDDSYERDIRSLKELENSFDNVKFIVIKGGSIVMEMQEIIEKILVG